MSDEPTATAPTGDQDRITDSAAQRVVLADDQFDFWIRMLREAVRTRQMSGLPLTHGYIKCYRDVIRHMEKQEARRV